MGGRGWWSWAMPGRAPCCRECGQHLTTTVISSHDQHLMPVVVNSHYLLPCRGAAAAAAAAWGAPWRCPAATTARAAAWRCPTAAASWTAAWRRPIAAAAGSAPWKGTIAAATGPTTHSSSSSSRAIAAAPTACPTAGRSWRGQRDAPPTAAYAAAGHVCGASQ